MMLHMLMRFIEAATQLLRTAKAVISSAQAARKALEQR